jgi:hypothetical protein
VRSAGALAYIHRPLGSAVGEIRVERELVATADDSVPVVQVVFRTLGEVLCEVSIRIPESRRRRTLRQPHASEPSRWSRSHIGLETARRS